MQHREKFSTIFTGDVETDKRFDELTGWCKRFQDTGLVPDPKTHKAGNLSFRDNGGFVITPSAKPFDSLSAGDLVKIEKADHENNVVYARGRNFPASESFIHAMIYERFPGINAVFHGECERITKNAALLGLAATKNFRPYGTVELAEEAVGALADCPDAKCVVLRDHGEVYTGRSMEEAGATALKILEIVETNGFSQ